VAVQYSTVTVASWLKASLAGTQILVKYFVLFHWPG